MTDRDHVEARSRRSRRSAWSAIRGVAHGALLSAPAMYADAQAKEQAVRHSDRHRAAGHRHPEGRPDRRRRLRGARSHYPASGYCDDALWNAAQLSIEAAEQMRDPAQMDGRARLLQRLASEYPTSKFAKQAPGVLQRSAAPLLKCPSIRRRRYAEAAASREAPAPRDPPAVAAALPCQPSRRCHAIGDPHRNHARAVLPDVVRVDHRSRRRSARSARRVIRTAPPLLRPHRHSSGPTPRRSDLPVRRLTPMSSARFASAGNRTTRCASCSRPRVSSM